VDLVIDLVLERALLGGEAVAERLELVFVGGGGQLGLDTRLEAGLGPSALKNLAGRGCSRSAPWAGSSRRASSKF